MAAILITVTPSTVQLISNIPKNVTITTNIPCMVFYTFDGSDPTIESNVYSDILNLPQNVSSVTLKIFATNGIDSSSILTLYYAPDITHTRYPHAKVTFLKKSYPSCGGDGGAPAVAYSQPGDDPIDAYGVQPIGGDGYGVTPDTYPVRKYDYNIPSYDIKYSETDDKGQTGKGIGTLPAKSKILYIPPDPEESFENKLTYNAKALVIFHDGTKPDSNEYNVFRAYYDGEDVVKAMDGGKLSTPGFSGGDFATNGGLISYHYNCKDNTYNFYYYDNRQCRWIISKEPVLQPTQKLPKTLMNFISPNFGDNHVYRWILFKKSSL